MKSREDFLRQAARLVQIWNNFVEALAEGKEKKTYGVDVSALVTDAAGPFDTLVGSLFQLAGHFKIIPPSQLEDKKIEGIDDLFETHMFFLISGLETAYQNRTSHPNPRIEADIFQNKNMLTSVLSNLLAKHLPIYRELVEDKGFKKYLKQKEGVEIFSDEALFTTSYSNIFIDSETKMFGLGKTLYSGVEKIREARNSRP